MKVWFSRSRPELREWFLVFPVPFPNIGKAFLVFSSSMKPRLSTGNWQARGVNWKTRTPTEDFLDLPLLDRSTTRVGFQLTRHNCQRMTNKPSVLELAQYFQLWSSCPGVPYVSRGGGQPVLHQPPGRLLYHMGGMWKEVATEAVLPILLRVEGSARRNPNIV